MYADSVHDRAFTNLQYIFKLPYVIPDYTYICMQGSLKGGAKGAMPLPGILPLPSP